MEAGGQDDSIDWEYELPRNVDWREFLISEVEGRAIGVMQIIDPEKEETHYWGNVEPNLRAIDIWIGEESDLGKGYGSQMMNLALERCFKDNNVIAVLIDPLASNEAAIRFYQRIGFRKVMRQNLGEDDCWVMRIDREEFFDKS